MSSGPTSSRPVRFETWRLASIYIIAALVFTGLLFRLINLQVFEGSAWTTSAVNNYTHNVSMPASRGIIYDRNGYILARNLASYNIVITPASLPDDDSDIQNIYRELSALIDVPVGGPVTDKSLAEAKLFAACVPGPGIGQLVALQDTLAPYSPIKVKCNVPEETARVVEEKSIDWPGVTVEVEPIRDYPTGSLTASLVGFLGPIPASLEEELKARGFIPNRDKIGYSGVEASLQDVLAGRNGLRVVQIDVAGTP
jgi:penicillin-binding protein 2